MASDGNPVKIPAASLVHGSQAQIPLSIQERSGRSLPPSGNSAAITAAAAAQAAQAATATSATSATQVATQTAARRQVQVSHAPATTTEELVAQLNKHLNFSGRADQYRVDPSSNDKVIQQINPATGNVIGEFLVSQFPALARSVGLSGGALIDQHA